MSMNYFQGLNEEQSLNDLHEEIAALKKETQFLYENNALFSKIVADYELFGGTERIIGLESENEKLKENITNFIAINGKYKETITRFIAENEKLKEIMNTINVDKNLICENRNEINNKFTMMQMSNQNLNEIIQSLRSEISTLKKSYDEKHTANFTNKIMLEKEILSLRKKLELSCDEKTKYATALELLKNKHTLLTKKHKKTIEERDFANKQLECIITNDKPHAPTKQLECITIQTNTNANSQPSTPKKNILKIVDPSGFAVSI